MPSQIILEPGEDAIFGYGSLLAKRSMEKTLGHEYGRPIAICCIPDWRRAWDVFVPNRGMYADERGGAPENIIYLNIRRAREASANGVLYVIPRGALAGFDAREWVYDRIDITETLEGVDVIGGRAWVYVAKPEYIVRSPMPKAYAVRQTYIDLVEAGLDELGQDFRVRYDASTDAMPSELVIQDRLTGSR